MNGMSAGFFGRLRMFDAFPKQRDEAQDFFHKTTSGGMNACW
jgi:hypothetical protein